MEETPQDGAPEEIVNEVEFDNEQTSEDPTRPARLERIEDGRLIAGVTTGLAYYFNVPLWLVRVAFIALMIPGGLGIVLYLVGAVALPHESEEEGLAISWASGTKRPSQWLGALVVVAGVSILLAVLTDGAAGLIWVVALIAAGVMLFRNDSDTPTPAKEFATDEATSNQEAVLAGAVAPKARRERAPRERKMREPREPRERKVRPPRPHSNLGRYTVAATLLGLSALGFADIVDALAPSALDYFSVGLGTIGLGLLIGTVWGRSRGLILVGLLLTPIVFFGSIIGPHIEGNNGQWRISSGDSWSEWTTVNHNNDTERINITTLGEGHIVDASVGSFRIDLTDTVIEPGATLKVELGAGEIVVIVPSDIRVQARARVVAGDVTVFGRNISGVGFIERDETVGPSGTVDLYVNVELGAGEITIEQG